MLQSRDRMANLIFKKTYYMLPTKDSRYKGTQKLKVKGMKKVSHTNGNQKKMKVAILISDFRNKYIVK